MKPEDCPKYERCNANICPLDPIWGKRVHLRGEPVCLWLRERSKAGGEARLRERLASDMAVAIDECYLNVTEATLTPGNGHGEIRRILRQSATNGSTLAAGDRLRALSGQSG